MTKAVTSFKSEFSSIASIFKLENGGFLISIKISFKRIYSTKNSSNLFTYSFYLHQSEILIAIFIKNSNKHVYMLFILAGTIPNLALKVN